MRLDVYRRSRGKGLIDLKAIPQQRRRVPWRVRLLVIFLLLGGCTTIPLTEVYHVQPVVLVVTTDLDLVARACWNAKVYVEGQPIGCYVPTSQPPTIYCPPNDAEVCWHEMFDHHIKHLVH